MLDDGLKSQLAAYLERLREPVQLIASLDEREASAGCASCCRRSRR